MPSPTGVTAVLLVLGIVLISQAYGQGRHHGGMKMGGMGMSMGGGSSWMTMQGAPTLSQVSSGNGISMGVDNMGSVYGRQSGGSWQQIDSPDMGLQFVAVGDGKIIGSNANHEVFVRTGVSGGNAFGTGWERMSGGGFAKQVAIGDGKIIGVEGEGEIVYRTGVSADSPFGNTWETMPGGGKMVAVGGGRIGVIRNDNSIWFRQGVSAGAPFGAGDATTGWEMMAGNLKQISIGRTAIVGVNTMNQVMYRPGVTSTSLGSSWQSLPGEYAYATIGNGKLMAISATGEIASRSVPTGEMPPDEKPTSKRIKIFISFIRPEFRMGGTGNPVIIWRA